MIENFNENNDMSDMFWEVEKGTGEVVNLVPNTSNTVQPVVLMRLGLFVPTLKSTKRGHQGEMSSMDATAELRQLAIVKTEGYENIHITGARLDMDNDFKTWVGIIHSFAKHKVIGDAVTLSFVDFIKLCGIPSSRSSKRLRERLGAPRGGIPTTPPPLAPRKNHIPPPFWLWFFSNMLKKRIIFKLIRRYLSCISSTVRYCSSLEQLTNWAERRALKRCIPTSRVY
ncbi:hypothetical protein ACK3F5_00640, partial (plasmid) [Photorhabdus asymbiotica UENP]